MVGLAATTFEPMYQCICSPPHYEWPMSSFFYPGRWQGLIASSTLYISKVYM